MTRGEVSGGGRKPWRQKGTGRARHGSIRSPIWRGGGVAFGPTPRKYNPGLPAKVRRLALKVALSSKARQGQVVVLEELQLEQPKTAVLARLLRQVVGSETALVVIAEPDRNIGLAARNLPGVRVLVARNINVYDVVKHGRVLLTQQALARLEEAFVT
jgi:large subunit ribosomal protein L4